MSNATWTDILQRFRGSIVQIFTIRGDYKIIEPYMPPRLQEARGSGFLISREGHLISNSHVVDKMISVSIRSEKVGNKSLKVDLIAICPSKDIALLKVTKESLQELEDAGGFEPLKFGDDWKLNPGERLVSIGYPLGRESIKIVEGGLVGYESFADETHKGSQSYLQIDLAINSGSSGSPLLSSEGLTVGISSAGIPSAVAQNTNFGIPSRVILSVLGEMFAREGTNNPIIEPPILGLFFQKITTFHFMLAGSEKEDEQVGLRVREIMPNSPFLNTPEGSIEVGDILQLIEYADPYNDPEAFQSESYRENVCRRCNAPPDTFISISRFGNIKVFVEGKEGEEESEFTKNRKVTLQEVMDTIPVDTKLTLQVLRPHKGAGYVSAPFRNIEQKNSIKTIYPGFDKLEYQIFSGAVWIPLSVNVIEAIGATKYLCSFLKYNARLTPKVMLAKIFPNNDMYDTDGFESTEILEFVDGKAISTLDDMRKALLEAKEFIVLETSSARQIVLSKKRAHQQDKEIHEKLSIRPTEFSLKLWENDV
jgi:S1-C subfamily serine protease